MIQILLATYNGEKYIEAQLNSLLGQTNRNWTLIAHDDGSTDETLNILLKYQARYPDIIKVLVDGLKFGSARDNFMYLLSVSTAEYVMFCDQDDIWLSKKIEKTFNKIKELDVLFPDLPIVVHADLIVVDDSLNSIAPSMFDYQGLDKSINSLSHILAKNNVTGCTMIMNRRAISVSLPILPCAIMHDWWIAANVIKHKGIVEFIDEPLIQYRQHGSNSVGAKENSILNFIFRCVTYFFNMEILNKVWHQAKSIDPELNVFYFFLRKSQITLKNLF